jgi:hypothetical protein
MDKGAARIGAGYSDEAYNTFPRYNVLNAILTDLERFDPDALPEFPELTELLILSGQTAQSIFTEDPSSEIAASAMTDERQRFADAISELASGQIPDMPALPYRRVLSSEEVKALWKRAEARWGATGSYFYPLADSTDSTLAAFDASAFHQQFSPETLQSYLRSLGVTRLFELREYGDNNYQLSVDAWEPYYDGAEGFWFTESLDWIMYASHEDSVTTGGILTDMARGNWPEAADHPWSI